VKKALVTGATGYVGSHLTKALIRDGWDVAVMVRPSSSLDMLKSVRKEAAFFEVDGSISAMFEAVGTFKPDVVFHIAAMVVGEHKPEDIEPLITSNIIFGTQLLDAMAYHGISSIVNTSTYWEHYESKEYSPVNLYAATKRAFQNLLQFYVEARGVRAITLKLFDPYGSNDPRPKLLNLLMKLAETGETLAMSLGEQKIDLVHIDDVVKAYLVAAQRLLDDKVESHEEYGVGTGNPITLKKLVGILEKQIGKNINIDWGARSYREREVMETCEHLAELKGWSAHVSIEEGVALMLSKKGNR